MKVHIPASSAAQGHGVPDVCGRHGRSAVAVGRVDIVVHPLWTWLFLFIGVITFFLVRLFTAKKLVLPEWPFCDQCLRKRKSALMVSAVLVLLGLAAIVIQILAHETRADMSAISVLLVVAGLIAFGFTSWTEIAGVKTDYDLEWVTVTGAHPKFAARSAELEDEPQP
jgi:hypothetical protein